MNQMTSILLPGKFPNHINVRTLSETSNVKHTRMVDDIRGRSSLSNSEAARVATRIHNLYQRVTSIDARHFEDSFRKLLYDFPELRLSSYSAPGKIFSSALKWSRWARGERIRLRPHDIITMRIELREFGKALNAWLSAHRKQRAMAA